MSDFWILVERSAAYAERAQWTEDQLASRAPAQIIEFDIAITDARSKAETWTMWAAGYRIMSGLCSGDERPRHRRAESGAKKSDFRLPMTHRAYYSATADIVYVG
jgi:hypothetical protein